MQMSPPELDYSALVDDRWYKREGGVLVPVELSLAQVSI